MIVDTRTLRESFAGKPSRELRRIVEAPEGEYTPEAVAVAREVLAHRPLEAEPPDAPERPESAAGQRQTFMAGLATLVVAGLVTRSLLRLLTALSTDPERVRLRWHELVASPWTWALGAIVALWVWRIRRSKNS